MNLLVFYTLNEAASVDRNINEKTYVSWWIPCGKYVVFMSVIVGMPHWLALLAICLTFQSCISDQKLDLTSISPAFYLFSSLRSTHYRGPSTEPVICCCQYFYVQAFAVRLFHETPQKKAVWHLTGKGTPTLVILEKNVWRKTLYDLHLRKMKKFEVLTSTQQKYGLGLTHICIG